MRFSIIAAVASLSSTALAQGLLGQIPQCAQTCFGSSLGSCGIADIACICGNASVINSVSCCVFATCSQADITATTTFAVNLCKTAGITVNTNPTCPSGSAAPSGSASASASRPASASASAPASGSASAPPASASASGSAPAASASASGSRAASASGTPAASGSASGASARPSTGAAAVPTAAAGYGLGMVVAGVLAVL